MERGNVMVLDFPARLSGIITLEAEVNRINQVMRAPDFAQQPDSVRQYYATERSNLVAIISKLHGYS